MFLQETQIGDAGQAGLVIAMLNIAAFLVGYRFSWIRQKLKTYTPLFGLVMLGSGLGLVFLANDLRLVFTAMFLSGMGIGTLMPFIFLSTANQVPADQNAPALSVINSALYLGQFFSPVIFSIFAVVNPVSGVRGSFLSGFWFVTFAIVLFLFFKFRSKIDK